MILSFTVRSEKCLGERREAEGCGGETKVITTHIKVPATLSISPNIRHLISPLSTLSSLSTFLLCLCLYLVTKEMQRTNILCINSSGGN